VVFKVWMLIILYAPPDRIFTLPPSLLFMQYLTGLMMLAGGGLNVAQAIEQAH